MIPILLTGALGYIGSHTAVALYQSGYLPILLDNLSRSDKRIKGQLDLLLNCHLSVCYADVRDTQNLRQVCEQYQPQGVIHFAAYKAVAESVSKPLDYYANNVESLLKLLEVMNEHKIPHLIFSSSCTVYGQPKQLPVTEESPILAAESPYGRSKQICESIILDSFAASAQNNLSQGAAVLLRYFNPAGAHPSGLIGELPLGRPQNLVPAITQSCIGKTPPLQVFGQDYPTRDGSCIRDFIHVMDLAEAHVLALNFLRTTQFHGVEKFNIGTGKGISVLEAIQAFEHSNGLKLKYHISTRRPQDISAIYANKEKAETILGWQAKYSLADIMRSAWNWEQKLAQTKLN